MEKKKRNFFDSVKDAFNGIIYCLTYEKNMKTHFLIAILVLLLGIYLKLSGEELVAVCLTIAGVIFAELVNTAIENTVDLATKEYSEKAKVAKDVAAGAVLVMAFMSIVIGIIVFLPKLILLFS